MNCPDCKTIIHDDDVRECPICGKSLYKRENPMKPDDYDPAEDADADPASYMKPTPVDTITGLVDEFGIILNGLHRLDSKPKRRVIKHRRKINHRPGWIDPRKRKKVDAGSAD